MPSQPPEPIKSGEHLDGKYLIRGVLGSSGMGVVYEAMHLALDRAVAVKLMTHASAALPDVVERFHREARLLARMQSPHVVRVFDAGRFDGEIPYLVMELLAGEDLSRLLQRDGPLPIERACRYALHAALGLHEAHRAGVVHRDVKPSNLFVVQEGASDYVKVIDFGIAKAAYEVGVEVTQPELIMGSPAYMSPEQIENASSTDARSDVWSLAVALFEMLTRTRAFRGEGVQGLLAAILTQPPRALHELLPDAPAGLADVLARAMRRNPAERTADVLTFARQIARFAGPEGQQFLAEHAAEEGEATEAGSPKPASLVRHESTTTTHSRLCLPVQPNAFVGRAATLAALDEAVSSGARLVTLLGMGGAGKTRLAVSFGWGALGAWSGGVWFVDLSEARTVEGIAFAVANVLDVPLGKDDPIAQLGASIAGRGRCLLVLDNFEQVVALASVTVERWLAGAPDARFVVTSRERLGLEAEMILEVDPLATAEATELFVARATAAHPSVDFGPDDRADIERLVEELDGLPLAIELAAARVRVMTPATMLGRMGDRFKLLAASTGRRGRQATLRGAIDWSWDLLCDDERRALAQLSVFEGGFTLDAVEAVLALDDLWPIDALQALVDKSLVRRAGDDRFALLISLQEYAAEKLDAMGGRAEAEVRHGRFFATFGEPEALDAQQVRWTAARWRALVAESDNLLRASARAVVRVDAEVAACAALGLWSVLEMRGPFSIGLAVFERALAITSEGSLLEARVLHGLGQAMRTLVRRDEARASFESALGSYRRLGARRGEADALCGLGILSLHLSDPSQAREKLEEAIAIYHALGDLRGEAHALGNLGSVHLQQGRLDDAAAAYARSTQIHRAVGNRRGESMVLGDRAGLLHVQGRLDEACVAYREALAANREVGNRHSEAMTLTNYAEALGDLGRRDESLAAFERAVKLWCQIGNRRGEGIARGEVAALLVAAGRSEEGIESFAASVSLLREIGDRYSTAQILALRAARLARSDEARARSDLAEAETIAEQLGVGPTSPLGERITRARRALEGT